ncbi:MAG: S-methyl-5-thioribose-1-phosphate isomerase, partial [Pseudomonadota bacterium]
MKVNGTPTRTIWVRTHPTGGNAGAVDIIDQTRLPHSFETKTLLTLEEAAHAIKAMLVRGAPLIGATAAYGLALAIHEDASDARLSGAYDTLHATRPTAVNLRWALDEMMAALKPLPTGEREAAAWARAAAIADEDVEICRQIGVNGLSIIRDIAAR